MSLVECKQCGFTKEFDIFPHKCPQCHAEGTLFRCGAWKQEQQTKFQKHDEINPEEHMNKVRTCWDCGRLATLRTGSLIAPKGEDAVVGLRFFCNSCHPNQRD